MRIALFKLGHGVQHIGTESTEKCLHDALRVSEYVDVDFPPLNEQDVRAKLALQREATIAWHTDQLALLMRQAE